MIQHVMYGEDPKAARTRLPSNEDCLVLKEGVVFFTYGWDHSSFVPKSLLDPISVSKNCFGDCQCRAYGWYLLAGINLGVLIGGGGALGYETMHVYRYRYLSYPLPCFCSWIRTTIGVTRSPSSLLRSSPPIASEDGGASHA